jgi:hypothetical protein
MSTLKPAMLAISIYATMAMSMALPLRSLIMRDVNASDPAICDYTFNSDDERQSLWDETGAGQWLDDFISKYGEGNWVGSHLIAFIWY